MLDDMITVNGWSFNAGGSAIGPLHLQPIDRFGFPETKMNRGGMLGIEGITGDDGQ